MTGASPGVAIAPRPSSLLFGLALDDLTLQSLDLGLISRLLTLTRKGFANVAAGFPNPAADYGRPDAQIPSYLGAGHTPFPYSLDRLELVLAAELQSLHLPPRLASSL